MPLSSMLSVFIVRPNIRVCAHRIWGEREGGGGAEGREGASEDNEGRKGHFPGRDWAMKLNILTFLGHHHLH